MYQDRIYSRGSGMSLEKVHKETRYVTKFTREKSGFDRRDGS